MNDFVTLLHLSLLRTARDGADVLKVLGSFVACSGIFGSSRLPLFGYSQEPPEKPSPTNSSVASAARLRIGSYP